MYKEVFFWACSFEVSAQGVAFCFGPVERQRIKAGGMWQSEAFASWQGCSQVKKEPGVVVHTSNPSALHDQVSDLV